MTTMVEDASRSASPASEQPPPASTHHRIVGLGGQQEAKVVVVVAAENSSTRGLQRHRSYHSQSKTHQRLDKFQESPRHRRAISVRWVIYMYLVMTLISFASLWKLLIPWQGSKLNYIVIFSFSKNVFLVVVSEKIINR